MSLDDYLQFVVALALVLALIALLAWLARRFGLGDRLTGTPRPGRHARRLALLEVMPLDSRRKLVLLRCDEREHLVLLNQSPASDLHLESRDAAHPNKPVERA